MTTTSQAPPIGAETCATCFHPLAEHIPAIDQCRHPAGVDAYCCCPAFELRT